MMNETILKVPDLKAREKLTDFLKKGYSAMCLQCHGVYKSAPQERYEDGHGGRYIDMCSCGCDLFSPLEEVIERAMTIEVKPRIINGISTMVFKEYNLKYCECVDKDGVKQVIHCGSAEYECGAKFDINDSSLVSGKDDFTRRSFKCNKSGYNIIILRNTPSENEDHKNEYMGQVINDWE